MMLIWSWMTVFWVASVIFWVTSTGTPRPERETAWGRLARELAPNVLDDITSLISMSDLPAKAADILAGKVRGRIVVDETA